jgi:hypothetical protein
MKMHGDIFLVLGAEPYEHASPICAALTKREALSAILGIRYRDAQEARNEYLETGLYPTWVDDIYYYFTKIPLGYGAFQPQRMAPRLPK